MNYALILSMTITDKYILSYFYTKSQTRILPEKFENISDDIKTYLDNRFIDSLSYIETVQRIKLNIGEHPKCICGKPVKYVGGTKVFLQSCGCVECAKQINQIHLKETTLKRYGVSNPAKLKESKEKQKQTNLNRYGVVSVLQNKNIAEKTKITNIKKYGCEIPQKSDIVKCKIANSNKESVLQKYGVDNVAKLSKTLKKTLETKRLNGTFTTSTVEEKIYNELVKVFGKDDVIRQYKSKEYPFACDFYIKSQKLYMEYNGCWTHGKHPFVPTNEYDLELIKKWKNKHTKYYDDAIYTWTVRDPNKRKIANDNNLNYIEFWDYNTFNEYLNQFRKL